MIVHFRSHDLYGAYPLNLAACCLWLLDVAKMQGVGVGTLTCLSASAHVYERDWADVERIIAKRWPKGLDYDARVAWRVERRDTGLRAEALTSEGDEVVAVFEGRSAASIRRQVERSGLVQSIGSALWLGQTLQEYEDAG